MSKYILTIDGENFLHKIREILKASGIRKGKVDVASTNLNLLFKKPLKSFQFSRKIFYVSRLHMYPETKRKSEELIRFQRKLRNNLVSQNYEFVVAGNVRAQKVGSRIIFREKGVDVKIAVDLISLVADRKIKKVVLCSSDSDLQPAIYELRRRKAEVVYLGFELNPNRGLMYTCNRTILLTNSGVMSALKRGKS